MNNFQQQAEADRLTKVINELKLTEAYTGIALPDPLDVARARYVALAGRTRPAVSAEQMERECSIELSRSTDASDAVIDKLAKRVIAARAGVQVIDVGRDLLASATLRAGETLWSTFKEDAVIGYLWMSVVKRADRAFTEVAESAKLLPDGYDDSRGFDDDSEIRRDAWRRLKTSHNDVTTAIKLRARWRAERWIVSPVLDTDDHFGLCKNATVIDDPRKVGSASYMIQSTLPDGDRPDAHKFPTVRYMAEASRRGATWWLALGPDQDQVARPLIAQASVDSGKPARSLTEPEMVERDERDRLTPEQLAAVNAFMNR